MAFLRATALIFSVHLRRVCWSRRVLGCLGLSAIAPLVALLVALATDRVPAGPIAVHLGWLLLLQIVVPLVALLAGSAVIAEEVEDRTITFLFTRPIPRQAVLLGRWLATLVVVLGLIAVSVALLVEAAEISEAPGPRVARDVSRPLLQSALLGGAVYSALFAVAGVFFRHPMIAGIAYAFAIEGFLANLPGGTQTLAVQYHLRCWIADTGGPLWRAVEGFSLTRFESGEHALLTLGLVLASTLALGCWRIARREFVLSA